MPRTKDDPASDGGAQRTVEPLIVHIPRIIRVIRNPMRGPMGSRRFGCRNQRWVYGLDGGAPADGHPARRKWVRFDLAANETDG